MVKVGSYRVLGELGEGGQAEVLLAVLETVPDAARARFTKLVVIKRLLPNLDRTHVTMFYDEARLAARFDHPNVVQTNEVGESDGYHFMVMEFLQGQSFDRVLRKIPITDANRDLLLFALAEALAGLHYAHELRDFDGTELGLVHRDFSPHNLFVTYGGQVKVLDFGVAKAERRNTKTNTGFIKGKLRYMPPEQAIAKPVDRRADLFAAGCILFHIAAGEPLWPGEFDDAQVLGGLFEDRYRKEVPGGNTAVNALLQRALAADPTQRPQTAEEMRRTLMADLRARRDVETLREELASFMQQSFREERAEVDRLIREAMTETEEADPTLPMAPESKRFRLTPVRDRKRVGQAPPSSETTAHTMSTKSAIAAAIPPARTKLWLLAALPVFAAIAWWARTPDLHTAAGSPETEHEPETKAIHSALDLPPIPPPEPLASAPPEPTSAPIASSELPPQVVSTDPLTEPRRTAKGAPSTTNKTAGAGKTTTSAGTSKTTENKTAPTSKTTENKTAGAGKSSGLDDWSKVGGPR